MHRFYRSVGFSRLTELDDEEKLIQDVCAHSDFMQMAQLEGGYKYCEYSRLFGDDCGITVCGIYDRENRFHMDHSFPFYWGRLKTEIESLGMDQHMRSLSFACACDDVRIGTTIIFYLTNTAEYLRTDPSFDSKDVTSTVYLSGLAESGAILLPVASSHKAPAEDPGKLERRTNLVRAAQNGDEEAIENLTMEDYDLYTTITRRVRKEDVYSIVDSYIIPYGMECDLYNIMGEIEEISETRNTVTKERIFRLSVRTNDIPLDICVNEKDLIGEPKVGRRYKGIVWLQGIVRFPPAAEGQL